eukprot:1810421-Pyramimonas_sp.AAC.1
MPPPPPMLRPRPKTETTEYPIICTGASNLPAHRCPHPPTAHWAKKHPALHLPARASVCTASPPTGCHG